MMAITTSNSIKVNPGLSPDLGADVVDSFEFIFSKIRGTAALAVRPPRHLISSRICQAVEHRAIRRVDIDVRAGDRAVGHIYPIGAQAR